MTNLRTVLDDDTVLLVYYSTVRGGWMWSHRNATMESYKDGLLATSLRPFHTRQAARGDFFMHNDYDNRTKNLAPWPLIAGIVLAIVAMLALVSYSNRAKAHDIYKDWKIGTQDCCHDVHCFATPVVQHQDGSWWARNHDGEWLPVPEKAIDWTTPYSGSHACIQQRSVDDEGEETEARVLCAAVGGNV